jgi:hypothetical protein
MTSEPALAQCATADCSSPESNRPFRQLGFSLFGPAGLKLVRGYCGACAKRRLAQTYLFLLAAISLCVIAIDPSPATFVVMPVINAVWWWILRGVLTQN